MKNTIQSLVLKGVSMQTPYLWQKAVADDLKITITSTAYAK